MSTTAEALTAPDGEVLPEQDHGLLGLVLIAQFHGLSADPNQLRHQFATGSTPFGKTELLLAAKSLGLKARIVSQTAERLATTALPALALRPDGRHFLIAKAVGDQVLVHDLDAGRPQTLSLEQLADRYAGRLMLVTSRATAAGSLTKFDFTWFIPAVIKYRRLLLEVLGVSFVLQLFALATPLLLTRHRTKSSG